MPPITRSRSADHPTSVALVGVGTLGSFVARLLVESPSIRLVAAVEEHDSSLWGQDLGSVVGLPATGILVSDSLPASIQPEVAVVVTYSRLTEVRPMVEELLRRGINVITSAEELGYPWHEFPDASRELDALARVHGATLLGAGANPGFIMDALPAVLSFAVSGVRSVQISRALDLTHQRRHKLAKLGVGIAPFVAGATGIIGHLGYRQSIEALADALGWALDQVIEDEVSVEVVARAARRGQSCSLEPGEVAVVRHAARGVCNGRTVIDLCGYYGFIEDGDQIPPGDTLLIQGVDQSFEVSFRPGMVSSVTTPAILLNLVGPVVEAAPGLRTTLDLRVRQFASVGVR